MQRLNVDAEVVLQHKFMEKKNIQWLFSTPVQEYNLSEYLTEDVARVLQSIQRSSNDLVDGIRGEENPQNIPECAELYKVFQKCVDEYSTSIGIRTSYICESWMNILTKGGSVGVHRHYNSVISAAFYPYVEPNSANLVFVSPLEAFRSMDAHASNSNFGKYTSNVCAMEPYTGKLVLFPSWLQHYVPPNKSNLRVTLSFNTRFKI